MVLQLDHFAVDGAETTIPIHCLKGAGADDGAIRETNLRADGSIGHRAIHDSTERDHGR